MFVCTPPRWGGFTQQKSLRSYLTTVTCLPHASPPIQPILVDLTGGGGHRISLQGPAAVFVCKLYVLGRRHAIQPNHIQPNHAHSARSHSVKSRTAYLGLSTCVLFLQPTTSNRITSSQITPNLNSKTHSSIHPNSSPLLSQPFI